MFRFIYKIVINPILGPIVVSSLALLLAAVFYLPSLSYENERKKIINESSQLVEHLKTFRSYYNEFVVTKVKQKVDLIVDYDHEFSSNTIPLPATTIHNLSEKLTVDEGIKINFYSDYPFPNRTNRVLDSFQKEAIEHFRKNKTTMFSKRDVIKEEDVYRVAFSDIMSSQTCVDCHNNRIDTPKNDWQLGDVRGVLEVISPLNNQFVLNSTQARNIIVFMLLVVAAFIVHYTILYFKKEKEAKEQTGVLQHEVEKRTKDLQESNFLLREHKKAVDASAIVSKANTKGIITYVNETFCEISGYTKEELIGQPHNVVRHPDMRKEVFKELWETIQNKKIFKGIIKNRKKDGSYYYVASTIVPILNNNSEISEYLSLRYDITELVETREKALSAQKAKSAFLANMSHEIRTPLNAIIGFSDILCDSIELDVNDKEKAKIISKSAKSLLNIINDVLDISKMESGKLELEETEFSLFELCESIVELFSVSAMEKKIKFIYTIDEHLPTKIQSDSTRLQQVISNLLSNALKFTPEYQDVFFDITVLKHNKNSSKIKFSVKDSGIGMTKEQQTLLFKPFSQADSGINRKFGGTGLGLAICWDIVQLMDSKIEVNSTYEKGSEFSFVIDFKSSYTPQQESQTGLKFGIYNAKEDIYLLKRSVEVYLKKVGQLYELTLHNSAKELDFIFFFDGCSKEDVELCKYHNSNAKTVFVGNQDELKPEVLNQMNYCIDLPIFGSKIYNIINDNSLLHEHIAQNAQSGVSFKAKILVAEDNLNNQTLIGLLLQKLGIEVTIANNGEEAILEFKKRAYDMILMDVNMPVLDGISAMKIIHELQKNHDHKVPIVALTANSIAGDKERYLHEGMDDYLSKPIEFEKLLKLLKHYLFKKESSKEISGLKEQEKVASTYLPYSKNDAVNQLGLDELTVDMLLDSFFLTLNADVAKLQEAIDSKDRTKITQAAHYLKGSCANLAMKEPTSILQKIEHDALNGCVQFDLNSLKESFETIKKSF